MIVLEPSTGKWPAVAASSTGFLAAWTFGSDGLEATVISPAGVPASPGGISFSPAQTAAIFNLSAGFDGSRYTLAYTRSSEVWAVQADIAGVPHAAPTAIEVSPKSIADIAAGGINGKALIAWTDRRETPSGFGVNYPDDVYALTIDSGGSISPPARAVSVSPPSQFGSRIAGDPATGFLVVFESWNSGRSRSVAGAHSWLHRSADEQGRPLVFTESMSQPHHRARSGPRAVFRPCPTRAGAWARCAPTARKLSIAAMWTSWPRDQPRTPSDSSS